MNDSLLILDAAIEGAGLTYYPKELIRDKLHSGKLEVILNQFSVNSDGFTYIFQNARKPCQN
jgi:hypothetical protein